ncbi:MAG: helix-turn-helix domain-containing protein, partial [Solirubrobacteraceae bacterium]
LGLAEQCGAEALAIRIDDELAATGVHLRREGGRGPEALTPAERRVAELAASGLTNREIGSTLFVSVKTVGTHLGHIYEKLDFQGPQARDQLAALLNGKDVAPSGPPGEGPNSPRAGPAAPQAGPAAGDQRPDSPGSGHVRTLDGAQRGSRR